MVGDSLNANLTGGTIPNDEGETRRPIRLVSNSLSRRIYDELSWNKPQHRRLDDTDFTLSGTWTNPTPSSIFEGATDKYHSSIVANSYAEITIPDGFENFAIVCRKFENFGSVDVSLNGGDISAYGNSTIDLARSKDNVSDVGNPYHTVDYSNLPSGANTIRISKQNNTDEVQVFGIYYWSGNTLMVYNVAHGGHTLKNLLDQHLKAEVLENDFDAILFQLTLMNECSKSTNLASPEIALNTILETIVKNKDIAFMSCHPFGIDPRDDTPNYYELYPSPLSMEDFNNTLKAVLHKNNLPFIDVFSIFKQKIENRGGTLESGEGGIWYTHDGQHQNEDGMREFWNIIRFLFEGKPIKY